MIRFLLTSAGVFFIQLLFAQQTPQVAETRLHPRLLTNADSGKLILNKLIQQEGWAKSLYEQIKHDVLPYVERHERDSMWITSRLQMYWQTRYTDVFIKNGSYAYASGHAPAPTVRFTGARDAATAYATPKLEDIKPYMDQQGQIYLQNKNSGAWEWVEQSKTGRIVEAVNTSIMNKARDAAMIYWYTGDERYAKFANDILNTYLMGIYYRNEPVDLNHGHDQTLVGLSSFEVIHEDILEPLTVTYDFLYDFIQKKKPKESQYFSVALKKWADLILKNGVPFNNWDLIEARFVADIAMVLNDDADYDDHKGTAYYLDQIINQSQTRQWSLTRLFNQGYDPHSAIWSECPGYSVGVLGDFTGFINFFDRTLHKDMMPLFPLLPKAVLAEAQYLYPNGSIVGFGDTHYGRISTRSIEDMIRNARAYHKTDQDQIFSRYLKVMSNINRRTSENNDRRGGFNSLFTTAPVHPSDSAGNGKLTDYITNTFWSPNVSWLVQRNGLDPKNGLMISEAGSSGNHAHANGIAMELYGRGIIISPEGGIGGSYFQSDYAEYYSQFPAHNTVVVDGISSYPTMKSNHPLSLNYCYPKPGSVSGYFKSLSVGDVSFLEPETNSDQNRLMSIIRTSDTTGYYLDIFRSRRKDGKDKYHDYIYHNLGQQLSLCDEMDQPLALTPTRKLTFADQELMGYDYWYDKKSVRTDENFKARFDLRLNPQKTVSMKMWMKGDQGREIFSVKAPPSRAWRDPDLLADSLASLPLPTVVARQTGEAWNHPFVAVYEPVDNENKGSINHISTLKIKTGDKSFVALKIQHTDGGSDLILNGNTAVSSAEVANTSVKGAFAVINTGAHKQLKSIFLANGYHIQCESFSITSKVPVNASLEYRDGQWLLINDQAVNVTIPARFGKSLHHSGNGKIIPLSGHLAKRSGVAVITYEVPELR